MNIDRECGNPPGSGKGVEHFLPDLGLMAARCPVLYVGQEIAELFYTYQESAKGGFTPPDTYPFAEFCRLVESEVDIDSVEMLG